MTTGRINQNGGLSGQFSATAVPADGEQLSGHRGVRNLAKGDELVVGD